MKNLLFITCLFLFYNSSVFGQLFTSYRFEDKDIDYGVFLYKTGMYELVISDQESDDLVFAILVSYGKYSLYKNQLVLVDSYNGYTMKFAYMKDYITSNQSFNWLNKKKLKEEKQLIDDDPIYLQYHNSPIVQQRAMFKKLNLNNLPFVCGKYKCGSFSWVLNTDHSFVYSYKNINLSQGTWKREGNEISLYDSSLNHQFYAFIDKRGLINLILPGELDLFTLHK